MWTFTLYAILLSPDGKSIFLRDSAEINPLPHTTIKDKESWQLDAAKPIVRNAIGKALGVENPYLLRRLRDFKDEDAKQGSLLYELADASPTVSGVWVSLASLPGRGLNTRQMEVIEQLAQVRVTGEYQPTLPPWMQRGWYEEMIRWIHSELSDLDLAVENIEPLRSWGLSYLAKVFTTDGGLYYFKTGIGTPLFTNEGLVMQELSALFPGTIPSPVCVDAAKRWFLLADLGDAIKDVETEIGVVVRCELVRKVAAIQMRSAEILPQLRKTSCLDRSISRMKAQIAAFFAEDDNLRGLDSAEIATLRQHIPTLMANCDVIANSPLPTTLVHGDLHISNMIYADDRFIIFDWSDAALSCPFFDMLLINFVRDDGERESALSAYLEAWSILIPIQQLRDLWQKALPLFWFYNAYAFQGIINSVEPDSTWEVSENVAWCLRPMLESLL